MTTPAKTPDAELIELIIKRDQYGSLANAAKAIGKDTSWLYRRLQEADRRNLSALSSASSEGHMRTIERFSGEVEGLRKQLANAEADRDKYKHRYDLAKAKRVKVDCVKPGKRLGGKVVDKVLLVPDIHSQFVDWSALQVVLDFAADWKPTKTVQMGDLLDCESINTFPKDETRTLKEEFGIGEHILDLLRPTHYCEGNHEERIQRPGLVNRSIRSLISVPDNLNLEARGIKHIDYDPYKWFDFGKLMVHHGNKCPDHAAKAMAMAMGGAVAFCHTHRIQTYTSRSIGHRETGFNIGTLTPVSLEYCKTVTGWQQGFAFAYIMADGDFSFYQVRLIGEGPFIIEGKEYGRHEACKPEGSV